MISIYDTVSLRKKKVLSSTDIGSKEYVSITYTSDTRMIAAQGNLKPQINESFTK